MRILVVCLIFFVSLFSNCSSDNKNQYWADGSPKILISKIKIGNNTFTIKKYYYEGTLDSLNFYQREMFYENGQIERVEHFDKKGLPQREWKYWYKNGQLGTIEHYINGKRHGKYESWLPDGSPNEKFTFQSDSIVLELR